MIEYSGELLLLIADLCEFVAAVDVLIKWSNPGELIKTVPPRVALPW